MKKAIVAVLALSAAAPIKFVQAQSPAAPLGVVMYGIVDAGLEYGRYSAGATGGSGHALRVSPGIHSNSRFGVRGTEDLGAGLRGIFNLEMGFHPDDGSFITNAAPSIGFGRRAWVGIEGGFGQLALGRDYVPGHYVRFNNDLMSYGLYGNLLASTRAAGTRINNGVYYLSPSFGGLRLRAAGGAGSEQFVEPRSAGRYAGLGLEYTQGPMFAAAAYERRFEVFPANATSTGHTNDFGAGAKYNIGAVTLTAGFWRNDPVGPNTATNGSSRAVWAGVGIKLGRGDLLLQGVQTRIDVATGVDPKATTYGLGYVYPLSRRTNLYAAYGGVRNNAAAAFGLMNGSVAVPAGGGRGSDPIGVAVGVRHFF